MATVLTTTTSQSIIRASTMNASEEVGDYVDMNLDINSVVTIFTVISCVLSILGTALIVGTYLAWKDLRTQPREILVFLSVADFLTALGYLYGTLQNFADVTVGCIAQSTLTTYSNLASLFWTVCLSVYLYILLVKSSKRTADEGMLGFHILSWGIPLAIVIVANAEGALGWSADYNTVGWCWIEINSPLFVLWVLISGKAWELAAYAVLPVIYILIKIHIKRETANYDQLSYKQQQTLDLVLRMDTKFMLIPLVFIFLRIWGTVRFFLYVSGSTLTDNAVLLLLHGVGNTFQGAANCILFCFMTPKIRRRLLNNLCPCCYHQGAWQGCRSGEEDVMTGGAAAVRLERGSPAEKKSLISPSGKYGSP